MKHEIPDLFKPEDFIDTISKMGVLCIADVDIVSNIANARFREIAEAWPVVQCDESQAFKMAWSGVFRTSDTHIARLAFITEIKPKECKHEPFKIEVRRDVLDQSGKLTTHSWIEATGKCKHCGKELIAEWKEKE